MCCSQDLLIDELSGYCELPESAAHLQVVPSQKVGCQKFLWTEELDLKAATIEATSVWRYAGCPRSDPVNDNWLCANTNTSLT